MVLGHGVAEAQGAGERLRLPHAYLRREISDGPEGDAEARRRPRRRLQAAAETDWHQSQRSGHAFDLRHRQPGHARRHRADWSDRPGRRRRRRDGHRHRTQAPQRPRHQGHPLQSSPGRRHDGRDDRAVVEAGQRSRLAHPDPHEGRADRGNRGPAAARALPDRVRPSRPACTA